MNSTNKFQTVIWAACFLILLQARQVMGNFPIYPDIYTTSVTFPAGYSVGDCVEFVKVNPIDAGASGNYEISISYTRGNIAAAATHVAAISHYNSNLWKEVGRVNNNKYVDGYLNFTVDCNPQYNNARFRIRAIDTYGLQEYPITVNIAITARNYNAGFNPLNNWSNDTTVDKFLPMTNDWDLYVGNLTSQDGAQLAIKASQNGNVGIGTPTPASKLDVRGVFHVVSPAFSQYTGGQGTYLGWNRSGGGGEVNFVNSKGGGTVSGFAFEDTNDGNTFNRLMTIHGNGSVGIGTAVPDNLQSWERVLDLYGNLHSKLLVRSSNIKTGIFSNHTWGTQEIGRIGTESNHDLGLMAGYGNVVMSLKLSGNVGIGTTTPDEKLAVNGKIHAREVRVDAKDWPDYVFKPEYKLPALNDLEKQIKEKGHLPDMPSAQVVETDGVALGNMVKQLLKSQEQLTLYIIKQEKQIKKLQQQLNGYGLRKKKSRK
ncbi:hypothetical protein [Pedobacter sp.]|uniref:hypothetical protein n=1 Tax=Pedobacter sp. TaxID=1411316 RepID=UPI003BAAEF99